MLRVIDGFGCLLPVVSIRQTAAIWLWGVIVVDSFSLLCIYLKTTWLFSLHNYERIRWHPFGKQFFHISMFAHNIVYTVFEYCWGISTNSYSIILRLSKTILRTFFLYFLWSRRLIRTSQASRHYRCLRLNWKWLFSTRIKLFMTLFKP